MIWPEIGRKLFHLIGLCYVACLVFLPRPVFITLFFFLTLILASSEIFRLCFKPFNAWIVNHCGALIRDHEKTRISGVLWMMLGVLGTAVLLASTSLAAASILYLIIGDAAASVLGKYIGGIKWPGSKKTLVGSAACFLSCVLIGFFVVLPGYGWKGVLVGATAATVFEWGVIPLDDNFTVPIGSALTFLIAL